MHARLGAWIITAALVTTLGGCSMLRLAWPQLPLLAHHWLDRQVGFTDEQSERVRELLGGWATWQRATQMAGHAALLAQWRAQAAGPLTPDQVCEASTTVLRRVEATLAQVVPAAAEVAATLQPAQLQHLERHLARGNDEFRRERMGSDAPQAARQRLVERLESFYGELSDTQRALVLAAAAQTPYDPAAWLAERQAQQRDLLGRLRGLQAEAAPAPRWQASLRDWLQQGLASPRPAYRGYQQRLYQHQCALVAQVHNSASPAQRRRLQDKLKAWEDDLRALAAAASPA